MWESYTWSHIAVCLCEVTRIRAGSKMRSMKQRSSFRLESWMPLWSLFLCTAGRWKLSQLVLRWESRLYRVALCSYVSCTVNAVVVVSVPESGFVFCFHRYVRERIRRPGPTFHRSVQCAADGDPGWTAQSGPAGPGWVCIHSSSLCSSATLYCHKYLLSAFTNVCTWSWHYLKPFGVLKH